MPLKTRYFSVKKIRPKLVIDLKFDTKSLPHEGGLVKG